MSALLFTPYISTVLTFGTALTGVTSGSYSVPSALYDNSPTGQQMRANATLLLTFGTPLTAGSGSPYVGLYPMSLPDGTTYPNPPGNAAAAPSPNAYEVVVQVVASANYSALIFPNIQLLPTKFAFSLYNNSGVNWSGGGTITATLFTYSPDYY
jgi:hypothetical protein